MWGSLKWDQGPVEAAMLSSNNRWQERRSERWDLTLTNVRSDAWAQGDADQVLLFSMMIGPESMLPSGGLCLLMSP